MITLPPRVIELINRPTIEAFYLVSIGANTRLTSLISGATLSDGREFVSGDLLAVDPPRLTSTVDREVYRLTIADPEMSYGSMFEAGMVGQYVEVRIGFIDAVTGLPELAVENTIISYGGTIDSTSLRIRVDEVGEAAAIISCSSPMSSLDMAKPFHTSRDFIRQITPADSCFDQLYEGSGAVFIKWGKT